MLILLLAACVPEAADPPAPTVSVTPTETLAAPAAATPTSALPPAPSRPAAVGYPGSTAPRITVSGTLAYEGKAAGTLHVDLLRFPADGGPPQLADSSALAGPGSWSFSVPGDAGPLTLMAYLDTDNNGPDPREPSAVPQAITVAGRDLADVKLGVMDHPTDMKVLPDPKAPPGKP